MAAMQAAWACQASFPTPTPTRNAGAAGSGASAASTTCAVDSRRAAQRRRLHFHGGHGARAAPSQGAGEALTAPCSAPWRKTSRALAQTRVPSRATQLLGGRLGDGRSGEGLPGKSLARGGRPGRGGSGKGQCGAGGGALGASSALKAVVFDCDGVILESEDLHRQAYNAAFRNFSVRCPGETRGPVLWSSDFYDILQNKIGGGKPKMRWYFNKNGWPHSSLLDRPPVTDEGRAKLIDALQDWKTTKYQDLIGSGEVPTRPGVVELMDEARARGLMVAVCSAATKSSVVFTLTSLLGKDRFERLDCFLAGDDVPKKKPDPIIYKLAAQRLGVLPTECVVVEDSVIGLQAAAGAGMPCVITHTSSTKDQDFTGAIGILPSLAGVTVGKLEQLLKNSPQPLNAVAGSNFELTAKYL